MENHWLDIDFSGSLTLKRFFFFPLALPPSLASPRPLFESLSFAGVVGNAWFYLYILRQVFQVGRDKRGCVSVYTLSAGESLMKSRKVLKKLIFQV